MKIILLEDVKALGKKGDVVKVSDGYARNMLIPQKKGVEANAKNLNTLKLEKAHQEKIAEQNLAEAKETASKIEGKTVVISIKAGEGGKLFGSVQTKDIADAVKANLGVQIDRKKIVIDQPIRTVGESDVKVKLHPEVSVALKINVVGEGN